MRTVHVEVWLRREVERSASIAALQQVPSGLLRSMDEWGGPGRSNVWKRKLDAAEVGQPAACVGVRTPTGEVDDDHSRGCLRVRRCAAERRDRRPGPRGGADTDGDARLQRVAAREPAVPWLNAFGRLIAHDWPPDALPAKRVPSSYPRRSCAKVARRRRTQMQCHGSWRLDRGRTSHSTVVIPRAGRRPPPR